MKRFPLPHLACSLLLGLTLVLASHGPARAITFTWGGAPIDTSNEDAATAAELAMFSPEGEVTFAIQGNQLTVVLTYTGFSGTPDPTTPADGGAAILMSLAGVLWDIDPAFTGNLTATSAMVSSLSSLVGVSSGHKRSLDQWASDLDDAGGGTNPNNLSSQWAFNDSISNLGTSASGSPLGSFGLGAVGSANLSSSLNDPFGPNQIIDSTTAGNFSNQSAFKSPPNGPDFNIISENFLFSENELKLGPFVSNSMTFDFYFTGGLTEEMITNVQPLFGTDGATLVPEPTSLLLLGTGILGLLGGRRFFWR